MSKFREKLRTLKRKPKSQPAESSDAFLNRPMVKCVVCAGLIDEEDLFCGNCGTEAPDRTKSGSDLQTQRTTHNFECQGCGASMSYDASAEALACPFCGRHELSARPDTAEIAPELVLPFIVTRDQAEANMRLYLDQGFWRPGDLSSGANIVQMHPVYVPYWVFSARTHTYFTADSNDLPRGARGDWRPVFGEHASEYMGLLVGASGALVAHETSELCPFNMDLGVSPHEVDLEHAIVEPFKVHRKYARPLARQGLEQLEAVACQVEYVPGKCRNMRVNTRIEGLSSQPVLVPVWIMAYHYQKQTFRFLVNGQSGKATGQAPKSFAKMLGAGVIAILAAILLFLLVSALAR